MVKTEKKIKSNKKLRSALLEYKKHMIKENDIKEYKNTLIGRSYN